MIVRALLLDFNGTLSDDEPLLCSIWQEIFAARGRPLSAEEYFERLAGLSDPEIAETWLGPDPAGIADAMAERVARYRERAADGSTVSAEARAAVRHAAARVPVGVVSGAPRADVELVLEAAGLADAVTAVVATEDVEHGKPDPAGYLGALALLGGIRPGEAVAVEDSEAGVAAAKAAGLRCVALRGTADPARLGAADELVERFDRALVERLLR